MASGEKSALKVPFQSQTESLATALAKRGTPGSVLLGLIFLVFWIVPTIFVLGLFLSLKHSASGNISDSGGLSTYWPLGLLALLVLYGIAYAGTKAVLNSIGTVMRDEAEAQKLMSQAFGGISVSSTGPIVTRLDHTTARRRTLKILEALVKHTAVVVKGTSITTVRANIFVTDDGTWLKVREGLHVKMQNAKDLSIQILNGYYSTGTAFKYFLPTMSMCTEKAAQGGRVWDHTPGPDEIQEKWLAPDINKKVAEELEKAEPNLSWIISMPIPYQVSPFVMACGVLNLDGLGAPLQHRDLLRKLLADASTAAALIGVINRTSDVLGGQCQRMSEGAHTLSNSAEKGCLVNRFALSPDEFDPVDCPEPSEEFKKELSRITGFEFFGRINTSEVAEFLRNQLRV